MDACKCTAAAALLLACTSSFCYAGHTGKVRFIGTVVESGCWNKPGQNELFCYRDKTVSHYSAAHVSSVSLDVSNAVVQKTFLDKQKQLEQLTINYY